MNHASSLTDLDLTIRCSYLLPDPGGEVVRELAEEIKRIRGSRPRGVRLRTPTGAVTLHEGSRLHWDDLAGIGIPGTGVCVAITDFPGGDIPAICIWIDPNERLRTWSTEIRQAIGHRGGGSSLDGLRGTGGFILMVGDVVGARVKDGTLRILAEVQDPGDFSSALRTWRDETLIRETFSSPAGDPAPSPDAS